MINRKINNTKMRQVKEEVKIVSQIFTDFRAFTKTLYSLNIQCHTFRAIYDKNMKVVNKRLSQSIPSSEISDLAERGYPVVNVNRFKYTYNELSTNC